MFCDYSAVHWQSLSTTNPIEPTFDTIRHRNCSSKGFLSRQGILSMMFKFGLFVEENWRRMRGFRPLGKVIEGIEFKVGIKVNNVDRGVA